MTAAGAVVRTVDVPVDPLAAFAAFTDEIDAWYQSGPYSWNNPERAVGIRFEPGVGGRWLEVWDEASGEGFEMGRLLVWEPGRRLVLAYRHVDLPPEPLTELEVRFDPVEGGTRVTLEHRGWERLPPDVVAAFVRPQAWVQFMRWFADHARSARPRRRP